MVKLVLLHKTGSIYDDVPEHVYDFPRQYLGAMQEAKGDWIVYYEPVKAGPRGYFAVAKVQDIIPKPNAPGRYHAMMAPGTFLEFDRTVPRLSEGRPLETVLAELDGTPKRGGVVQRAVRRLPDADFAEVPGTHMSSVTKPDLGRAMAEWLGPAEG